MRPRTEEAVVSLDLSRLKLEKCRSRNPLLCIMFIMLCRMWLELWHAAAGAASGGKTSFTPSIRCRGEQWVRTGQGWVRADPGRLSIMCSELPAGKTSLNQVSSRYAGWRKRVSLFPRKITKSNSNEKLNVSKANGTFNKEILQQVQSSHLTGHFSFYLIFSWKIKERAV